MECLPAVVAADWVPFVVADVRVRGEEDAERVAWGWTRLTLGKGGGVRRRGGYLVRRTS